MVAVKNRLDYQKINVALLAAAGFSLSVSEWLLSFSIIAMAILWILSGSIRNVTVKSSRRTAIMIFILMYAVYVLWMINTEDFLAGLKELRLKLPLLVLPIVIGFSHPLRKNEIRLILTFFISGVVISSAAGTLLNGGKFITGIVDNRELSPFISHIRLSLMAAFAIFCSIAIYYKEKENKFSTLYLVTTLWLLIYLIFLFSFSGIVTFIFSSVFTFIIFTLKTRLLFIKSISLLFLIIILIVPVLIFYRQFKFFYSDGGAYARPFENYTFSGNPYFHDTVRKDIENGNRVWVYVCEDELRKEWNRVSAISYDSLDMKGQYLKYTLIRYLTSAGLRKDSAGLSYLTPADIGNVERGITNKMFSFWGPWKSKLYEIIWQIDYYKNGGNPSGHSITQRIEFVKTGWHIFLRYPVFGTGTGDLRKEYLMQYEIDNSPLNPAYRLLSHNQFITFLASFGITGIIIICFSILFPCIAQGALKRYLPVLFILIIIISMLWEDTLESHTGVSFFAYFYSLFVFGYEETDVRGTEKIY